MVSHATDPEDPTVSSPASTSRTVMSERARAFIDAPRFAVVATLDPDGAPLQAVAWYLVDGNSIVFNSRAGRRWPANLARDRRVAVLIADEYSYVELRGRVEIDDDFERGREVIATLARMYEKDPARLAGMLQRFATEDRVSFRLRPDDVLEHFD